MGIRINKDLVNDQQLEVLLTEYQASQASAEHYDLLTWTVSSLFITVTVAIVGFVIESDARPGTKVFLLVCAGVIIIYCLILTKITQSFKKQKYERCQKIEEALRKNVIYVENHLQTRNNDFKGWGSILLWAILGILLLAILLLIPFAASQLL